MTLLGRTGTSRSELRPSEQGFEQRQGLRSTHLEMIWEEMIWDLQDLHDLLHSEQLKQVQAPALWAPFLAASGPVEVTVCAHLGPEGPA